jgi:two-component system, chemotaxis family, sensor kinase CheA
MSTDVPNEYAQFRKTFFEECTEVLADMEGRLGQLQEGPAADDDLNAIFRAVHSIKAGAGAFQFVELVKFSHIFETLLDQLRDGRIQADDRVVNTLIRAGDVLSALVAAAQEEQQIEEGYGSDVAEELQALLDGNKPAKAKAAEPADTGKAAEADKPAGGAVEGYRIEFRPHAELFRHANEPLLLIRELKRLGPVTAHCHRNKLPTLFDIEPEEAYLAWTFELQSTCSKKDVLEVFEFVDEDCELEVEELRAAAEASRIAQAPAEASEDDSDDSAPQGAGNARGAGAAAAQTQKSQRNAASSIRVDIARIDRLVNMAGELVIAQAMLAQQIADHFSEAGQETIRGHEDIATLTRELQECVMAVRMQPVKSVFARMPRLVREVAGKLGKAVRLVTSGEHTEVDKTVVEELADPLTHMIRNAVDHGVESPEARLAKGKPEEGFIELSASHVGSNILITLVDDGAGINREKLLQKATDRGIIAPGATLTDDEIDDLIFAPGLSTASAVTDFSGRGVGMDVVRRNITNLGGRIQVQSTPGEGTRFTLVIPLTLAVLDGMAVAVGSQRYILPLTSILESFKPSPSQIRNLAGGGQLASVRGEFYRILHLDRLFNVPAAVEHPSEGLVVLVETAGGMTVGIKVDELLGQQQVVIKSLQENFYPVPGISGATILGNGSVALILDIEELAKLCERQHHAAAAAAKAAMEPEDSSLPCLPQSASAPTQHALTA